MNLIEEIEAVRDIKSEFLLDWWPRIKAALEAARGIKTYGHICALGVKCPACDAERKFDAAMEGKL